MDPSRLLEELDELIEGYRQQIATLSQKLARHEAARRILQTESQRANSKRMQREMTMESRRKLSAQRNEDPLVKAANKAGHTLRSLAKAVGCSAALLTQARHDDRSISPAIARKVAEITGFAATKKNWPQLRTE